MKLTTYEIRSLMDSYGLGDTYSSLINATLYANDSYKRAAKLGYNPIEEWLIVQNETIREFDEHSNFVYEITKRMVCAKLVFDDICKEYHIEFIEH